MRYALLDEIIGHSSTIDQLRTICSRGTVPHALLFCGPSGIGKRTTARAFALALTNSANASEQDVAASAHLIRRGNHPDVHLVQKESDKKDLPVETIRELCKKLQLKPYSGDYSVAIIDNVEEMSIASANALLMTLEEPPPHSYLILVTEAPQRLPETIISRCQLVHFGELRSDELLRIIHSLLPDGGTLPEALAAQLHGSLAPLELASFIDPKTLEPIDVKQLSDHGKKLLDERKRLGERISNAFNGSGGESGLLSLASELASEKESLPLVWQIIRDTARSKLRDSSSEGAGAEAEVLLEALKSEQLSRERTLNPQLQLSSLLLKAGAKRV